jgi:hypothetical protein
VTGHGGESRQHMYETTKHGHLGTNNYSMTTVLNGSSHILPEKFRRITTGTGDLPAAMLSNDLVEYKWPASVVRDVALLFPVAHSVPLIYVWAGRYRRLFTSARAFMSVSDSFQTYI